MICVWWNFGNIHFEIVPDGRSIDSKLYCQQLEIMHVALREKYPALINRQQGLLQHDNAHPHTS